MRQKIFGDFRGEIRTLSIPSPKDEVMPGIIWGKYDELFTPAFWAVQAWLCDPELSCQMYRLGDTFVEEIAACLLGGHGIPADIGLAAYAQMKDSGLLFKDEVSEDDFFKVLDAPLQIGGREVRYRFARQKSKYLFAAVSKCNQEPPPINDELMLREWLLTIPGIGFKTSAWIVRNYLCSDKVAIIDIHVYRAGVLAGIFDLPCKVQKNYLKMEHRFLQFANAIGAKASLLDSIIWENMRRLNKTAIGMLGTN